MTHFTYNRILVAVIFIAAMTWVSWRGVEIGERIQNILLAVQYIALAIFVVAALWQFFAGTAPNPTPWRKPRRSYWKLWLTVHDWPRTC